MNNQKNAKDLLENATKYGLVETLYENFKCNFKVRIPFSDKSFETSIDNLDFSIRSSNALKRGGLMKVGDVVDAIETGSLLKIRNLGRKSYNEIKTKILIFGYNDLSEQEKYTFWGTVSNN